MKESTTSLQQAFWRWFSFSILALIVAAALPAMSADVFIDEGDSDFAATPVSTPKAHADKAPAMKMPASEDVPPAGAGMGSEAGSDDQLFGSEEMAPPASTGDVPPVAMPESTPAPVKKAAKKAAPAEKKSEKKSKKKASKKAEKKSKSSKKKDSKKSKSKRKVAAFAGGQYATTSKACAMESAPGAGDSVGMTVAARKLWVEDAGNTSYWKVHTKSGSAAFVSRDCF